MAKLRSCLKIMLVRFDVVVGNPPYTYRNTKLYTRFTKKALELSDHVTFIIPVDLDSNHVTLKAHNALVKKHLVRMSENVSHEFNVGLDNIYCVTLDKNVVNEVDEYVDPLRDYRPTYPERARLKVYKGSNSVEKAEELTDGVRAVLRVLRGNTIVYRTISNNIVNQVNKNRKVSSPWLVYVNHTPSGGLFNCSYEKNNGQVWGMNVIVIEAASESEAKALQTWLTSKTIQEEVLKMFDLKGVYTISKEMLQLLPWFEFDKYEV